MSEAAAVPVCASLGGIATTSQLRARGVGRLALHRALTEATLIRIRKGTFALATLDPACLAAVEHGGRLGCASAGEAHGLWMVPYSGVHVALARHAHRYPHAECECIEHWVITDGERALVPVFDCLIQIADCCDDETFFAALGSALNKRLISAPDRSRLRECVPARLRWLVEFAVATSESGLESLVRLRLHLIGIALVAQVPIDGVGRVDFVLGDRLILELDGRLNHDSIQHRHRDLVRDATAATLGFITLRFDYPMVMHDWPLVEAAILAVLRADAHPSVLRNI